MNQPTNQLIKTLDRFVTRLEQRGDKLFQPFSAGRLRMLQGDFEVRSALGRVRRTQKACLPLPHSLAFAWEHLAPRTLIRLKINPSILTLWPPQDLIELQVGYRWHGFNGKSMPEWDKSLVVFAEIDGDPLALRTDELAIDSPVWVSHREDGRHFFVEFAPSLAAFYQSIIEKICRMEASF
jgi:hypothetical protein